MRRTRMRGDARLIAACPLRVRASSRHGDHDGLEDHVLGGLTLIAWGENTGTTRMPSSTYFTMVVDRTGAVCQPKTALPAAQAFTSGDDLIAHPDGSIAWANVQNTRIQLVKLAP